MAAKEAPKPAEKRAKRPGKREDAGRRVRGRTKALRASVAKTAGPPARRASAIGLKAFAIALKALRDGLSSLLAGLRVIAGLVLGGLQEIGALWLRAAELAGGALLWVERTARPYLIAAGRTVARALGFAERVVTPERAVAAVVVCAAAVLAISQFIDYRGVEIGAGAYTGVESVAPAPQTDRETTGSVHGYAMVPVALVIIAATVLALRGRWRVARVIPVLGALTIAVSLLLDARKGLQEGGLAIAYQGVNAVLIEGFWLQLSSAAVLIVTGLLLARYTRVRAPARGRRSTARGERTRRRRFRFAGVRA